MRLWLRRLWHHIKILTCPHDPYFGGPEWDALYAEAIELGLTKEKR